MKPRKALLKRYKITKKAKSVCKNYVQLKGCKYVLSGLKKRCPGYRCTNFERMKTIYEPESKGKM